MSCSVLILAKNEEKHIADCIDSCRSFSDEVVVIDDFSTDRTAEIAQSHGAKIVQHAMNGDWGQQQTFAVEQASCDWIFFIDADERCHPDAAEEIRRIVETKDYKAYWIQRLNYFNGKRVRFGMLSPDWVVRLLPKKGTYVTGYVHPKIVFEVSEAKLKGKMTHYTYQSWMQLEGKMNKYSTLAAKKYFDEGKRSFPFFDLVLRPFFAFVKMYILKGGFMDGLLGFGLSVNYASYTLSKYFKLMELNCKLGETK